MKFKVETQALSKAKFDVSVIGIFEGEDVGEVLRKVDPAFPKVFLQNLVQAIELERFKGKSGQSISLPTYGAIACKKLHLVGLGAFKDFDSQLTRKLAANLARRLASNGTKPLVMYAFRFDPIVSLAKKQSQRVAAKSAGKVQESSGTSIKNHLQAFVEGWKLGSYTFLKYKSSSNGTEAAAKSASRSHAKAVAVPKTEWESLAFQGLKLPAKDFAKIVARGEAIGDATCLARKLIAEPPAFMTPTMLAQEARRVARDSGLGCRVFELPQIEKMKMGSFLGVARGAKEPPRFIVLRYEPSTTPKRTIAIVGKGITFDSGGLSLKPAQSMEHMKYDMSGAAAVIATMQVIGKIKPSVAVLGVVAATENMPGDGALHPGDVLTAMNGKTIEVNNTDAEGRLILADALTYAVREGVDELIDVATLTGAVVTALGRVAAGVMGSDQALINRVIAAGSRAGEKFWQLPMFDEYKETLKSDIADLKNAGSRGEAGSSSAGMFLREFVDGKPWAHLDIAGVAWLEKERDECNKGGTGFGVRTLCHYLLDG